MKNSFPKLAMWLIVALALFAIYKQFATPPVAAQVSYSQFIQQVHEGQIKSVTIQGQTLTVTPSTGQVPYSLTAPRDPNLVQDLLKANVNVVAKPPEQPSFLLSLLINWGPLILLVVIWFVFMRQMQGGGGRGAGGAFSFGKSRARMMDANQNRITFADVAGCEEAKEEVAELVDYLRDPQRFQRLGGRIPRGVLMVGQPGTGKTLLAKAIAGEAKVPFFTISGSDFVEMFVGVGASRVRDMFENAKKHAPCIIFIDEIDAVGRQRGVGLGGGNDEREQTLNQMLVEMDGFESGQSVIVIAATNRPDVLDPALLRPGRFDRQVMVGLPDVRGREQILKVHMRKVPLAANVQPEILARGTPGFSGADLANLVNEAALFAARRNGRTVDMIDFEKAKDKIIMGAERKSMVMPKEELLNTAYHEAGHALVGRLLTRNDPVHKVTIVPRGRALGVTMSLPEKDRYGMDKETMLEMISMMFGGRIGEEVFMGHMTTGASNDFERATKMAREMVTRYGMSEKMGPVVYVDDQPEPFLGRSIGRTTHLSEETQREIDAEVRRILDEQYAVARKLIEDNADKMHAMAKALMEWETIDSDQLDDIFAGKPPRPPKEPEKPLDEQYAQPGTPVQTMAQNAAPAQSVQPAQPSATQPPAQSAQPEAAPQAEATSPAESAKAPVEPAAAAEPAVAEPAAAAENPAPTEAQQDNDQPKT